MDRDALTQLLTGQHVRLWPFSSRHLPRPTIYQVWAAIEHEHGWAKLFYWQDVPDDQKGDLGAFIHYMRDKTPLIVEHLGHQGVGGLVWFDPDIPGLRTNISLWYARALWGGPALEASRIATRYAHQCLYYPAIWGHTPWRAALGHGLKCGYKHVVTFPDYVLIGGKPRPMYILLHKE